MSISRTPQALELCPVPSVFPLFAQPVIDWIERRPGTLVVECQPVFSSDGEPFAGFAVYDDTNCELHSLVVKRAFCAFHDEIESALLSHANVGNHWQKTLEVPDLRRKMTHNPWRLLNALISER